MRLRRLWMACLLLGALITLVMTAERGRVPAVATALLQKPPPEAARPEPGPAVRPVSRAAGGTEAGVPALSPSQARLLDRAQLVQERREPPDADGRVRQVRLWKTHFKHPFLLEELWLPTQGAAPVQRVFSVADHALVRFPDGWTAAAIDGWARQRGFRVRQALKTVPVVLLAHPQPSLEAADRLLQAVRDSFPGAAVAERDYLVFPTRLPDDARFASLWGLHNTGQVPGVADADIDAPQAWDLSVGRRDVLVGVIDSGLDREHPDLQANVWRNPGEVAGNGLDDDGNGFVDDVHGWDFFSNDADPADEDVHGTHCAGTIGAVGNNGSGVAGVCWEVSLVGIRFLGPGGGTTSDAIESVHYATRLGVDLTSNSWGGGGYSRLLEQAIEEAGANGILFVAAAGNDGLNNDLLAHYPSNYPAANLVAVASSTAYDQRSSFSNYGAQSVDLAAPGSGVLSTIPGSAYASLSGTSMATPHVTGALALAKSIAPTVSAADLKQALLQSVDRLPAFAANTLSGGRLNAARLLESLAGPHPLLILTGVRELPGGNGDGIANPGEALALDVEVVNRGTAAATQVVARIASTAGGASALSFSPAEVAVGSLQPGESRVLGQAFVLHSPPGLATPHEETLEVRLSDAAGTAERVQRLPFSLFSSSRVSGRVTDAGSGAGLAAASVLFEGAEGVTTVATGADGAYAAALKEGIYQVSARATTHLRTPTVTLELPPARDGLDFALTRPLLRLEPAAVVATALLGDVVIRDLELSNAGSAPLTWSLRARAAGAPTPARQPLPAVAAQEQPRLQAEFGKVSAPRIAALEAPLASLAGVTVGAVVSTWDRSVLLGDLTARGARVVNLRTPFSTAALAGVQAVLLDDAIAQLADNDLQALRDWVQAGGGLLCEADNSGSLPSLRRLLAGAGLELVYEGFRDLDLTDIRPHPITRDITRVVVTESGLSAIWSGTAVPLIVEASGRAHATVSRFGNGVIVFVGNEITNAVNFVSGDGRRLANQIVDGLVAGPPWLQVSPLAGTLAPGDAQTLQLTLDSRELDGGLHAAELVLASNQPDAPETVVPVRLQVTPVPELQLEAETVAFGEVIERTPAHEVLTLRNTGRTTLMVQAPRWLGDGAAAFATQPATAFQIPAGGVLALKVLFLPEAGRGEHAAQLQLLSNDPRRPEVRVAVRGTHLPAPDIVLKPDYLAVSLRQGQSLSRSFSLENRGQGELVFAARMRFPFGTADDWVQVQNTSGRLAPGERTTLTLPFAAGTRAPETLVAELQVTSQDPDTPLLTRPVSLRITPAAVPVFEPLPLEFPDGFLGQTMRQWLRLSNAGAAAFTLQSVVSLNRSFRVITPLPLVVPAGGTRGIQVEFTPRQAGLAQSYLLFATDAGLDFVYVPVAGQGLCAPRLEVKPARLQLSLAPGATAEVPLRIRNAGGGVLDWELQAVGGWPEWLPNGAWAARLAGGESAELNLRVDSNPLPPGRHRIELLVTSRTPPFLQVRVPVVLQVPDRGHLRALPERLDLGPMLLGEERLLAFQLANRGSRPVDILAVTASSPELQCQWPAGTVRQEPLARQSLTALFRPAQAGGFAGKLRLRTRGNVTTWVEIPVTAEVIVPPAMALRPASWSESLLPGQVLRREFEVVNEGGRDLFWQAELNQPVGAPSTAGSLEQVLQRLDARQAGLTALIPDRFDFSEGSSGYSIQDGGGGLYQAGNLISTNLNGGQLVAYSNGVPARHASLGAASRYFTRKHPGLFVFAADLAAPTQFRISGGLGTGTGRQVSASVLRRQGYTGFFKSVHGGSRPSVNHLLVVPDHAALAHSFSADPARDDHSVSGLPAAGRLYALVFAANGAVSEAQAARLLDHFLVHIVHDAAVPWLSVLTAEGRSPAGGRAIMALQVDTRGLAAGRHTATVSLRGDAPATPVLELPVALDVASGGVLAVAPARLELPAVPLGQALTRTLVLHNTGNAGLRIEGVAGAGPGWSVPEAAAPFVLESGESRHLGVRFAPETVGEQTTNLTWISPALDTLQTAVPVRGTGLLPVGVEESAAEPPSAAANRHAAAVGLELHLQADLLAPVPSWAFPVTRVGESTVQTLTLTNPGGRSLSLVCRSSAPEFRLPDTPLILPAGQSLQLPCRFLPAQAGVWRARLQISVPELSAAPLTVELTGAAVTGWPVQAAGFEASAPAPGLQRGDAWHEEAGLRFEAPDGLLRLGAATMTAGACLQLRGDAAPLQVTRAGGGGFRLLAVDLAPGRRPSGGEAEVNFHGVRRDGRSVTARLRVSAPEFRTYELPADFTDLRRVTVNGDPARLDQLVFVRQPESGADDAGPWMAPPADPVGLDLDGDAIPETLLSRLPDDPAGQGFEFRHPADWAAPDWRIEASLDGELWTGWSSGGDARVEILEPGRGRILLPGPPWRFRIAAPSR